MRPSSKDRAVAWGQCNFIIVWKEPHLYDMMEGENEVLLPRIETPNGFNMHHLHMDAC